MQACVQSLLATTEGMDCRITIADDGSTQEELLRWYKDVAPMMGVRVVYNKDKHGFACNVNFGVRQTRARIDDPEIRHKETWRVRRRTKDDEALGPLEEEWQKRYGPNGRMVCLVNSDVTAVGSWLSKLLGVFDKRGIIGVVGPKLLFPEDSADQARPAGKVQSCGFYYKLNRLPDHRFMAWSRDNPKVNEFRDDLQGITGAVLMFPRAVFEATGGFNEMYGSVFEDAEFCLAVRAMGLKVAYCPEAVLYHEVGASFTDERPYPYRRNMQLFAQRCGQMIQYDMWRVL